MDNNKEKEGEEQELPLEQRIAQYEAMLPAHVDVRRRIRSDSRLNQLLIDNGQLLQNFY